MPLPLTIVAKLPSRSVASLCLFFGALSGFAAAPATNAPAINAPVAVPAPVVAPATKASVAAPVSAPVVVPAPAPAPVAVTAPAPPERRERPGGPPGRKPPRRSFPPNRPEVLAPGTNVVTKPVAGFNYIHDELKEGPWSVHVFKASRAHPGWELDTTVGRGDTFGMAVVSEQVKTIPHDCGRPVAAINGDFYDYARNYPGDPEGLQIMRGELVSAPYPTRVCMWVDAAGNMHRTNVLSRFHITWPSGTNTQFELNEARASDAAVLYTSIVGATTRSIGGRELVLERHGTNQWLPLRIGQTYTAQVREVRETGNSPLDKDVLVLSLGPVIAPSLPKVAAGAILKISTATVPDLTGARTAIGGGPTLVQEGKSKSWGLFQARHPRSAVGWNKDFVFFVVVDGRQSGSIGMSYSELADYLVKLGCQEAINMDGGGSATLWAYGNTMNNPCQGIERPAANTLVVVLKTKPEDKVEPKPEPKPEK